MFFVFCEDCAEGQGLFGSLSYFYYAVQGKERKGIRKIIDTIIDDEVGRRGEGSFLLFYSLFLVPQLMR